MIDARKGDAYGKAPRFFLALGCKRRRQAVGAALWLLMTACGIDGDEVPRSSGLPGCIGAGIPRYEYLSIEDCY
jgi:hypothetical protein